MVVFGDLAGRHGVSSKGIHTRTALFEVVREGGEAGEHDRRHEDEERQGGLAPGHRAGKEDALLRVAEELERPKHPQGYEKVSVLWPAGFEAPVGR